MAPHLLEDVLAKEPGALGPPLLLSHVFLEEDHDPDAAEKVIVNLLEKFPDPPYATHNLKVLRARRVLVSA